MTTKTVGQRIGLGSAQGHAVLADLFALKAMAVCAGWFAGCASIGVCRFAGRMGPFASTPPFHYKSRRTDQAAVERRIMAIAETRVRYGYRRVHVLLRREGWEINMKKTRKT